MKKTVIAVLLTTASFISIKAAEITITNSRSNPIQVGLNQGSLNIVQPGDKKKLDTGFGSIESVEWQQLDDNQWFQLVFQDKIGFATLGSTMEILQDGSYNTSHAGSGVAPAYDVGVE